MTRDDVVVGFIGLGIMGGRMAANLQKAGYKLVVHDLQRQAASHHLNVGAAWADSPPVPFKPLYISRSSSPMR